MSLSISSVSLLSLPRGVPSLESHSPSSTFTHHEGKIQNMWCASLILQLPYATAAPQLHVYCHLSRHLTTPSERNLVSPPWHSRKKWENIAVEISVVTLLTYDGGWQREAPWNFPWKQNTQLLQLLFDIFPDPFCLFHFIHWKVFKILQQECFFSCKSEENLIMAHLSASCINLKAPRRS